jgi:hypothetical protein
MKNKLQNICGFYTASREQRKNEIARGLGKKGTMGYEKQGGYECDGENRKCPIYFNPLECYLRGLEE